ncbi:MAG TPA: phosphatidylinositol mannoside acyltransferase [Nocardioidaceae bacterium]|nr:phosphatidylinositol mannoside acyltransferase [Nocardioidaceae bacterium]
MRHALGAWAYRLGWSIVCHVPERLVAPTTDRIADRLWTRRGRAVRRLEANLARIEPVDDAALRSLSRRAMRSYVRYWTEVFRLPRWTPEEIRAAVIPHHTDRVKDSLRAGRGVVAALPHMGNWDLAGAWACDDGMPVTTVAERLRPESLYDDFVRYRESLGMEVLPLSGGQPTMPLLERRLRDGRLVCLLADRDLSRHSVAVSLLGEQARLPIGPALLAQRTGALLLPVTTAYEGRHMHVRVHEPVDVGSGEGAVVKATAAVADVFSAAIRRDPADWHMLQRVFAGDVEPR